MTQYLLSVWHSPDNPMPDNPAEMQKLVAQVDTFNNELQASGAWVFAGGLHEPSSATVVRATGGDPIITDGPFAETKEQLGGFWIIEAANEDAAIRWADKATVACQGAVEVRPFQSMPES